MASSGTFTSGRYGNSSVGPYLTLAWTQVSQSVANNTTTLDLTLRFHWSASIAYTFHSRTGSVQGNSYTYSGSVSGASGSRVLRTQRVTITHNSNGARSVTLSGNITGLGLSYSGNRVNTMSVSGTANLNTIPRASTLSKFSFNAHLKNGVANQINYTIDRKSTAFRHQIQLRDGATTLKTWDNIDSNGASTLTLTSSEVNTLLNRMSTSTTKSYTLRVATRSGNNGGWIGSAVSRNATATVHSDVKPTVGAVSLSQTGNPVSTHTLQGFSKIKASFTRSAGYGATISNSSIQVRRRSGGADSQTINSNDGTTANPVSLSGVYEARGTARDSRGRTTNTAWATITVEWYSAPTIINFSASRNGSTPTTVNISRTTTHKILGTSNHLTYTIQRRQGTGAWTNVNTGASGSITTTVWDPSGATGSATSTGNSVTQSYEFRLVVTDKLGGRAESLQSVSTQRVVLDIHKNEGVGIGKIHEDGVLDVDGNIHMGGELNLSPVSSASGLASARINMTSNHLNGHGFIGYYGGNRNNRLAWVGIGSTSTSDFSINATEAGYGINLSGNSVKVNNDEIVARGSNSNGNWVQLYDGTQICWARRTSTSSFVNGAAGLRRTNNNNWTYAKAFAVTPPETFFQVSSATGYTWAGLGANATSLTRSSFSVFATATGTNVPEVSCMAIGRWK